jgi:hypothetical protein
MICDPSDIIPISGCLTQGCINESVTDLAVITSLDVIMLVRRMRFIEQIDSKWRHIDWQYFWQRMDTNTWKEWRISRQKWICASQRNIITILYTSNPNNDIEDIIENNICGVLFSYWKMTSFRHNVRIRHVVCHKWSRTCWDHRLHWIFHPGKSMCASMHLY